LENSWIKMREVSLSYQMPEKWMNKINGIESVRFSLVGRNLFYFYNSLPDRINPEGGNGRKWTRIRMGILSRNTLLLPRDKSIFLKKSASSFCGSSKRIKNEKI